MHLPGMATRVAEKCIRNAMFIISYTFIYLCAFDVTVIISKHFLIFFLTGKQGQYLRLELKIRG
jgi:hypothetical protein